MKSSGNNYLCKCKYGFEKIRSTNNACGGKFSLLNIDNNNLKDHKNGNYNNNNEMIVNLYGAACIRSDYIVNC